MRTKARHSIRKPRLTTGAHRSGFAFPNLGAERPALHGEEEKAVGFKSILVPIDFSLASEKALEFASTFAKGSPAKLILLHVIEPVMMPDFASSFPLIVDDYRAAAERKGQLEALVKHKAIDPGLVGRLVVRQGRPFYEITEAARTLKADLIIIATHGYTGIKHALVGSTTEQVVRHARCPVLVVRQQDKTEKSTSSD